MGEKLYKTPFIGADGNRVEVNETEARGLVADGIRIVGLPKTATSTDEGETTEGSAE